MSIFKKIRPLQAGEKIVDKFGAITPAFGLLWQQLFGNSDFLEETKQDHDTDLDQLSALTGTGIAVRTSNTPTWTLREIEVGDGLTITNPGGVGGNPLIELDGATTGGVLPVVDGSIPPVFLQNPDGNLIYVGV